ncbi:PRC-barrel domain-containing protein [Quadrisphaera sp. KR29]|uniref:PRC-barrel domain-containing protein n=1 Tax=Quadrisphaera sp. KR29 TaxID=3461391 RepID=UPI004043FD8F
MITDAEVERIPGAAVYGSDGEKIGKAGAVYRDDQTGRPEWVTVQTGLFGTSESFVPLAQAQFDGDDLRVPYDKSKVKDAPRVDDEGHLDISEEDRLFEYYGVGTTGQSGSAEHHDAGARDLRHDDRRDGHGLGAAAAGAGAGGVAGAAAAHRGDDRYDDRRDGYRDDDRRDGYRDDRPAGYADDRRDDRYDRRDDRRDDDRGVMDKIKDKLDGDDRRDDRRDERRDGFRDDVRDGYRSDDRRDDDRGRGTGAAAAGGAGLGGLAAAAAAHRDDRRDDRGGYDRDDRGGYDRDGRDGRVSRVTGTDTSTARDDRFADGEDIGRRGDRSDSGLGSAPLAAGAGAAGGYAAGSAGGQRKPRLSQWVLVKKEDVIEVPADEAERLARQQDGGSLR